ncbi:hypothetical protein ITP53_12850 [Nonomuraea sp. K274]|uniref:Uncharacterized protein n=1 Tax=Nonomuraea cypriaca TaxID=1187855 RepID=A0A931A7U4_9ACTN|nr:hypothetical protein [Nonomuraea cypriaca]MBF8186615.1 hypothetical protein [Nonomuraea cypriaca]
MLIPAAAATTPRSIRAVSPFSAQAAQLDEITGVGPVAAEEPAGNSVLPVVYQLLSDP